MPFQWSSIIESSQASSKKNMWIWLQHSTAQNLAGNSWSNHCSLNWTSKLLILCHLYLRSTYQSYCWKKSCTTDWMYKTLKKKIDKVPTSNWCRISSQQQYLLVFTVDSCWFTQPLSIAAWINFPEPTSHDAKYFFSGDLHQSPMGSPPKWVLQHGPHNDSRTPGRNFQDLPLPGKVA